MALIDAIDSYLAPRHVNMGPIAPLGRDGAAPENVAKAAPIVVWKHAMRDTMAKAQPYDTPQMRRPLASKLSERDARAIACRIESERKNDRYLSDFPGLFHLSV